MIKRFLKNVIFLGDFNNKITRLGDGKYEVGASVKLHKLIKFINMDGYGGIEDFNHRTWTSWWLHSDECRNWH